MPLYTDSLEDYFIDFFKGIYDVEEREGQRYMLRMLRPAHSLIAIQGWMEDHMSVMMEDSDLIRAIIMSTDLQKIKATLQKWKDTL